MLLVLAWLAEILFLGLLAILLCYDLVDWFYSANLLSFELALKLQLPRLLQLRLAQGLGTALYLTLSLILWLELASLGSKIGLVYWGLIAMGYVLLTTFLVQDLRNRKVSQKPISSMVMQHAERDGRSDRTIQT